MLWAATDWQLNTSTYTASCEKQWSPCHTHMSACAFGSAACSLPSVLWLDEVEVWSLEADERNHHPAALSSFQNQHATPYRGGQINDLTVQVAGADLQRTDGTDRCDEASIWTGFNNHSKLIRTYLLTVRIWRVVSLMMLLWGSASRKIHLLQTPVAHLRARASDRRRVWSESHFQRSRASETRRPMNPLPRHWRRALKCHSNLSLRHASPLPHQRLTWNMCKCQKRR